ncbi:MAG: nitroreductase family protein [Candidatus Omnitrophica bacterium]|nr:nitroreductase family protein [Candidatus Omnitrophota bacterium]
MSVYATILNRRSVRSFRQKKIALKILRQLVNAARVAPSGANLQPCEFVVVDKIETLEKVFSALSWAGYIRPAGDPPEGKRPTAYIVVVVNKRKKPLCPEADVSAAIENILLVAQEKGLGSCWLGSIDRNKIRKALAIPLYCEIKYVVALGYPEEQPKLEKLKSSVKYWKDKRGRLHVPKRSLQEVLHKNKY